MEDVIDIYVPDRGYFYYGVFKKGGKYPWGATLTETDAYAVILGLQRHGGWEAIEFEVRSLDDDN